LILEENIQAYITKKEIEQIKQKYFNMYQEYKKIKYIFSREKRKFIKQYQHLEKDILKKNEAYLKQELIECSSFFDNINGKSLDTQQRMAIITEEDSLLVVAGAGSGKTLTILGKIKYLIERKKISPQKILCISFTNTITVELKNKIKEVVGYEIDVVTFHKLGINILKQNKIIPNIIEENTMLNIIHKYFIEYIFQEENLKKLYRYYPLKEDILSFKNYSNDKKIFLYKDLIHLVVTFLNLFKARGYKKEDWVKIEEEVKKELNRLIKNKNRFLIKIIKEIYFRYEEYLEEENKIDFHDMIREATNLLQNGGFCNSYDYIIVDEYQDTSLIRYELLQEIKKMGNSKLLAVGDDWQSIYRFTGCDIDIFTNFEHYFPYSKTLKIETTYRNPQELIDVAGNFIMKNNKQIKKNLKSNKRIKKPIKIYYYQKKEEFDTLLDNILKKDMIYYLLLRNNRDIDFLRQNSHYQFNGNQVIYLKFPDIEIYYYTVHSSKGLECDNVILINVEDSNIGFPNQTLDDPILKYVSKKDLYLYEEERRLFYTAITRTKNVAYLFCDKRKPSIFVKEIIKENPDKIEEIKKDKSMI
jgi:DNA helicase-4